MYLGISYPFYELLADRYKLFAIFTLKICENKGASLALFSLIIRIFEVNLENTGTRCEKY